MAVEAMKPPPVATPDPNLSMGIQLMALERRERLVHGLKIALVWIVLILILGLFLLSLDFDPNYMFQHIQFVLAGAGLTIGISIVSILIAAVLALLGALGRLSTNSIAQGISGFYVSLIRGTPLLIQIFIVPAGPIIDCLLGKAADFKPAVIELG